MRRKRGNRGTWLPVNPTILGAESSGRTWTQYVDSLPTTAVQGDWVMRATALTLDDTPDVDTATESTLRDYVEGQDYVLERVVGKVFVALSQNEEQRVIQALCTVALAILPTAQGGILPDLPPEEWNPHFAKNAQQPWLWRRQWMLGNDGIFQPYQGCYPRSNMFGASVQDSPFIDTKGTKRRVGKEQRLYLISVMEKMDGSLDQVEVDSDMRVVYDVRLFGKMVRGSNRSSF